MMSKPILWHQLQNNNLEIQLLKHPGKLGIVLKGYPRLSETFISQEILALQNLGFNIQIISLRHPTDKTVHRVNKEITAPVTYLPEYVRGEPLRVLKAWWKTRKLPGYRLAKSIFRKDLARDFSSNRARRFAQGMVIAAEFGEKLSCFYSHFLHTPTSATRYGALICSKPFAVSAHAKDIWTSPDWEITEKLDDCEWLATCTAGGRDHLQKLAPDPAKIHLVYHGLDLARFPRSSAKPSKRDGYNSNNPLRIITVGRAVSKKGLDSLLDAFALLDKKLHWQWTHIGGGPLLDKLQAQAKTLDIADKCDFRGSLAQSDVIDAYRESDLFVLPCRIDDNGDRDGLPNVIVEAQSQGLAVISSPISGIPELIENNINGLLVEPNSPKKLAKAISCLMTKPELRNKMGAAGNKKVRSDFNHLTTIGDLADLLDGLLETAKKSKTQMTKQIKLPTVMFYVQHLLGIGHVFRAMRVAKGLTRAGCETHIVWGGTKIPSMDTKGIHMHHLDAVHVENENFKSLVMDSGEEMDDQGKEKRAAHLLDLFNTINPDILITEAYPFGRRQMRFELIPLMEAAKATKPKPMVVCSIRDILQENRAPKRVRESLDSIHQWFDLVMVHGDPELIPIEATLENSEEINDKIRYTGLVTPDPVDMNIPASLSPDVIISAGGGAVGKALVRAAVDTMVLSKSYNSNWVITTGPDLPQAEFDAISNRAPKGMKITRFIIDLAAVMARSKVSVSRAGYNTIGDLLRAQCPAVLVPFTGGLETEQLRRSRMMEKQGLATVLLDENLTPSTLAKAVDDAAALGAKKAKFKLDGADSAAKLLIDGFQKHRA